MTMKRWIFRFCECGQQGLELVGFERDCRHDEWTPKGLKRRYEKSALSELNDENEGH